MSPGCSAASAPTRATAPAPAPASADADAPLNAAAITALQARIRALSPSRREAFSAGSNGSDLQAVKIALSGLQPRPSRLVLFGSRARGEARPDSDIDLLVVMPQPRLTP